MADAIRYQNISRLYQTILRRLPDQDGLNYFANTPWSYEQIATQLATSPEAYAINSGQMFDLSTIPFAEFAGVQTQIVAPPSNQDYPSAMVVDAFNLSQGPLPEFHSQEILSTDPAPYSQLVYQGLSEPVGEPIQSNMQTIDANSVFRRTAAPADEMVTRPGGLTEQIASLYRQILNREPDADGLAFFASSGMSLETIQANLMNSMEYRSQHIPITNPTDPLSVFNEPLGPGINPILPVLAGNVGPQPADLRPVITPGFTTTMERIEGSLPPSVTNTNTNFPVVTASEVARPNPQPAVNNPAPQMAGMDLVSSLSGALPNASGLGTALAQDQQNTAKAAAADSEQKSNSVGILLGLGVLAFLFARKK